MVPSAVMAAWQPQVSHIGSSFLLGQRFILASYAPCSMYHIFHSKSIIYLTYLTNEGISGMLFIRREDRKLWLHHPGINAFSPPRAANSSCCCGEPARR